mgnify:CR=1 FL=1
MRTSRMARPTALRRLMLAALLGGALAALFVSPAPAAAQAQSAGAQGEWTVPERRARRANPVVASAEVLARGREVYRRECESCHGRAGRGDGPKARELKSKVADLVSAHAQEQSDGALFYKITEGRGDMPNGKALTEDERWSVIHYLRSLAPQRP